ncbi:hypothetical protein Tco_0034279 [Tanacetum coccineum]
MFQQHHGESLSEAWTRFKDLLQKVPHHGIDLWLQVQIFYDHVNTIRRQTIDPSAGGMLRDQNAKESWALLEDLALYDNESWNDPRDFTKPVKAIALPQDVPSTSDCRLIELENQYCMEDPEQAFVEYASSCTDEAGDSNTKEEDDSSTNACDLDLGGMVKGRADIKEQGKEENEIETDMEVEEEIEEEESEFETDDSIIDCHLREIVFGRPFIDETGLVYNEEEGTVMISQDDKKNTIKMLTHGDI